MSTVGICMNIETTALSQYRNFDFNSMCKIHGKTLMAGDGGLFAIEGETDGGTEIDAYVLTRRFGVAQDARARVAINQFRLRKVWVGGEINGNFYITITDDEDNARNYVVRPFHKDLKQHGMEVTVGRDGVGRYFSCKIANMNGVDFSIDRIDVEPVILNRRPRRV